MAAAPVLFNEDSEPSPPSSVRAASPAASPPKARQRRAKKKRHREEVAAPEGLFQDWFNEPAAGEGSDSSPPARTRKRKKQESPSGSDADGGLFDSLDVGAGAAPIEFDEDLQRRKEEYLRKLEAAETQRKRQSKYTELAVLRNTLILLSRALPLWTRRGMAALPEMTEGFAHVDWPLEVRCGRVFGVAATLNRLWLDSFGFAGTAKASPVSDKTFVTDREAATRIDALEKEIAKRREAARAWTLPHFAGHKTSSKHVREKLAAMCEPTSLELPAYFHVTPAHIAETQKTIDKYFPPDQRCWLRSSAETLSGASSEEVGEEEEGSPASRVISFSEAASDEPTSAKSPAAVTAGAAEGGEESALGTEAGAVEDEPPAERAVPESDASAVSRASVEGTIVTPPKVSSATRRRRALAAREKMRRALAADRKAPKESAFVEEAAEESDEDGGAGGEEEESDEEGDAEEVLEMFEFDETAIEAERGDEGAVKALLRQQMEEREAAIFRKLFKNAGSAESEEVVEEGANPARKVDLGRREVAHVRFLKPVNASASGGGSGVQSDFEESLGDLEDSSEAEEPAGIVDQENIPARPRAAKPARVSVGAGAEDELAVMARVLNAD